MAKSLRSTPGVRQEYNRADADDIYRAQKAINERINDIAKTFGKDSQIYRDYIAPMTVGSLSPHVRIDKYGLTKFKTGKNNKNADVVYVLERMLDKSTAGEILKRTAEQMDMAINIQHAKATGKKVARREDVVAAAKGVHDLELQVYGRVDEMYDEAENYYRKEYRKQKGYSSNKKLSKQEERDIKQKAKEYINMHFDKRKFMKDIHASHGKLTSAQLRYAARYLDKNADNAKLLGLDKMDREKQAKSRRIRS